jgi:hypothetical protein
MQTFPGFEHIYTLEEPSTDGSYFCEVEPGINALDITRFETKPGKAVKILWRSSTDHPSDVIWTCGAFGLVVHQRIIDQLKEYGISGWKTYSVEVLNRRGVSYDNYTGLSISGRCNSVDLSRSSIILEEYPGGWYPHFLGYYFDELSWDGTNMFMERADSGGCVSAHIFVTEQVRAIVRRAAIKNVIFQRLTDVTLLTSIFEIGSPKTLPADFRSRVAAAYSTANVPIPREYSVP